MNKIIVVGAGITGCYLAYFLAKSGHNVTLIDSSNIGEQASAKNPGGLNPLHGPGIPGVLSDFAMNAFKLHSYHQNEIKKLSTIDHHYHKVSRLEVALNNNELNSLKQSAHLYDQADGFSSQQLSAKDIRDLNIPLSSNIIGGLMTHGNAMVNSSNYTKSIGEAAITLGAQFKKAKATNIKTDGNRITAIQTQHETITCDSVIFSTGAWFEEVSNWLGFEIPITPVKGELLQANLTGVNLPFHLTRGAVGIYSISANDVWIGGTLEKVGFDANPTISGRNKILSEIEQIYPSIRDAPISKQTAAFRPSTPDRLPIIDLATEWSNAYIAGGGGAKGMLLSIGIADTISKHINNEKSLKQEGVFTLTRFKK